MALQTAAQLAQLYETALVGILSGQLSSYTIGGQSFSLHNLKELEESYRYWRRQADKATYGTGTLLDSNAADTEGYY